MPTSSAGCGTGRQFGKVPLRGPPWFRRCAQRPEPPARILYRAGRCASPGSPPQRLSPGCSRMRRPDLELEMPGCRPEYERAAWTTRLACSADILAGPASAQRARQVQGCDYEHHAGPSLCRSKCCLPLGAFYHSPACAGRNRRCHRNPLLRRLSLGPAHRAR